MAYHHEAWAIINERTKNILSVDEKFEVYSDESKAWEECLRLKKLNPDYNLTVKYTRIALLWRG